MAIRSFGAQVNPASCTHAGQEVPSCLGSSVGKARVCVWGELSLSPAKGLLHPTGERAALKGRSYLLPTKRSRGKTVLASELRAQLPPAPTLPPT